MQRGCFITVEGGEGVGKSTNIAWLASLLEARGLTVRLTREPGGTPMAERIRALLLEHGDEPLPDLAELLLFFASRSININNTIVPALDAGEWVICDRFTDATRAYQGSGRRLDRSRIETLADWVHDGLQPDLTVLLDAPPNVGRTRAAQRGAADRMESEQDEFHARVRNGYLQLARDEPGRFAVIDANRDLGQIQAAIKAAVEPLLSAGAGP